MRNIILPWIIATVLLLLAFYFYWQQREAASRLNIADNKLEEASERIEEQQADIDSLENMVLPPDTMTLVPPGGAEFVDEIGTLSESDIKKLQAKGLKNPEADLMNDLNRKQSQLIPAEGTLGGTMAIRDSRILNDRYALAYYEDGHTGGYLILKYDVNNGKINWKVLDNSKL